MPSMEIVNLLIRVYDRYGSKQVRPYGTSPEEEHGTAFTIAGVPATFSIHTRGGQLPSGTYDIQIESFPPGEYIHTALVDLEGLMDLVAKVSGPVDGWPR